jgi:hypothetical protein
MPPAAVRAIVNPYARGGVQYGRPNVHGQISSAELSAALNRARARLARENVRRQMGGGKPRGFRR